MKRAGRRTCAQKLRGVAGADPENELGGGQFRGSGGRSPTEADDFSQLKGYLDVTSGILGGHAPPLKSASESGIK